MKRNTKQDALKHARRKKKKAINQNSSTITHTTEFIVAWIHSARQTARPDLAMIKISNGRSSFGRNKTVCFLYLFQTYCELSGCMDTETRGNPRQHTFARVDYSRETLYACLCQSIMNFSASHFFSFILLRPPNFVSSHMLLTYEYRDAI